MMRRLAVSMNGISVAYLIGLVNSVMATINSFGVHLNDTQRVAIVSLVNASLILAVHLSHRIGEANTTGQASQVAKTKMDEAVTRETGV